MLFRKGMWPRLSDGSVTAAFRYWKRPTVKAGGTLQSPVGQLAIESVRVVDSAAVSEETARRAGFDTVHDLLADLGPAPADRLLYCVEFHLLGADPRIALRGDDRLSANELSGVQQRLDRFDRSAEAPWTEMTLQLIADRPGVVSTELAEVAGMDRARFKLNVRKLKALGLTESLEVGYRISPRGLVVLNAIPHSESTS